jgi:Bifunctional DNA primase/polymerase, N-terminal
VSAEPDRGPRLPLLAAARAAFAPHPPSPLAAALAYAERGIPVLPCHYPVRDGTAGWSGLACSCQQPDCSTPARHPLPAGGVEEASTDPERLRRWWRRHPPANVGLATGVVVDVLDLDEATGHQLAQAGVPLGPVAQTGTGRLQFYCAPSGLRDLDVRGAFASLPGRSRIWWRGSGGYVLAPPSRVLTGASRWLQGLTAPLPDVMALMGVLVPALWRVELDG